MMLKALCLFVLCIIVCGIPDPLLDAVSVADEYAVAKMIKKDKNILVSGELPVEIDRLDHYGRTQLLNCGASHSASKHISEIDKSCVNIVKLLIANGANVTAVDNYGEGALSLAVYRGYFDLCRFLIDSGVDIDRQDNNGKTAIMKAVGHGFKNIYDLLIQNNANVLLHDFEGLTIFHYATRLAASNNIFVPFLEHIIQTIKALNSSFMIDSFKDNDGRTALHYGVLLHCFKCCKILVEAGADPRVTDKFEISATKMVPDDSEELLHYLLESTVTYIENEHKKWLEQNDL